MNITIIPLVVGLLGTNCYVLTVDGEGIVIDPGGDAVRIMDVVEREKVSISAIVLTHGHFDHMTAADEIKKATGAPILLHEADLAVYRSAPQQAIYFGFQPCPVPEPDRFIADRDTISLGSYNLTVLHTPGHSPGGVCLLAGGHLFSGDTLFAGSVGRTDLPGASSDDLKRSLKNVILPLPDDLEIHPGHGPATSLARERRSNTFLSDQGWW